MADKSLLSFAKELAKYSTSAERSNDLICDIEKILERKLNKDEEFKLRTNIEIFISSIIVFTVSSLDIDGDEKIFFVSKYKEEINTISQIFGGWSVDRIEEYTNLLNAATRLYSSWFKNVKGIPTQKDYEILWGDFADGVIMGLNFGPQITPENETQYNLLSKIIKLKLATLTYEVKKTIQENIGVFLE
jgi:hypothetical protein